MSGAGQESFSQSVSQLVSQSVRQSVNPPRHSLCFDYRIARFRQLIFAAVVAAVPVVCGVSVVSAYFA